MEGNRSLILVHLGLDDVGHFLLTTPIPVLSN